MLVYITCHHLHTCFITHLFTMNENPSKSSAAGGGSRPEITTRLSPAPAAGEFAHIEGYVDYCIIFMSGGCTVLHF